MAGPLHRVFMLCCALLISLAAMPVFARPVAADIQCNTGRTDDGTSYWSGTRLDTYNTIVMVESKILEERPHVWPVGSDVSAWTMLTHEPTPSGQQFWAQIGWNEHRSSTSTQVHTTFVQWTDQYGGIGSIFDIPSAPIGSTPNYITTFDPNTMLATLYRDSTGEASVYLGWTPDKAQVFGEIHTASSQMPGGTNVHVTMRNTMYQIQGNNPVAFNQAPNQYPSVDWAWSWKRSSTAYDIWDTKCAS
jgi:hypothetical protein